VVLYEISEIVGLQRIELLAWTGLEERQPSAESTIETSKNGGEYYVPHKHVPPRQWISFAGSSCITGCLQYYAEVCGRVKSLAATLYYERKASM
jgi:hypothetical protein